MLELIKFRLSMWKASQLWHYMHLLYLNWILLVSRVEEWSWDVKYGRHFSEVDYSFHFISDEESVWDSDGYR